MANILNLMDDTNTNLYIKRVEKVGYGIQLVSVHVYNSQYKHLGHLNITTNIGKRSPDGTYRIGNNYIQGMIPNIPRSRIAKYDKYIKELVQRNLDYLQQIGTDVEIDKQNYSYSLYSKKTRFRSSNTKSRKPIDLEYSISIDAKDKTPCGLIEINKHYLYRKRTPMYTIVLNYIKIGAVVHDNVGILTRALSIIDIVDKDE